jgi:L-arabinose isomerase
VTDNDSNEVEIWFVTGSQHLYEPVVLEQVQDHSRRIAAALDASERIPVKVVARPVVATSEEIRALVLEANSAPRCAGLIMWMHTFSPAKMWIGGLAALRKPFVHLHTQFERDLPWGEIDQDFMNLHQSAHGDREFGFITTRMRLERKIVVGHWKEPEVQDSLAVWMRAARAWHDWQGAKFARLGDNMRDVAVTEGDKVAAELRFGFSVNSFGIGDLVERVDAASDAEVDRLIAEYLDRYRVAPELRTGGARHASLRDAARIEIGLRGFLGDGGFKGFTDSFQILHGLEQLPGLAVQRLMNEGYGFGAEGDWKTCALVRAMKVMADGLPGGTSFMEDYTYHLQPSGERVLGAHMLEICESIAAETPSLEVHPLSIGGKGDPARLVFTAPAGPAINASLMDLGNRFRMLVTEIDVVAPGGELTRLPVARAVWSCRPDFRTAVTAWILAGGAHHTGFSQALGAEHLEGFAAMAGIEFLTIDERTELRAFKQELRTGEVYYHIAQGLGRV